MLKRYNTHGTSRLARILAVAAASAVVASLAIVGTAAAQFGPRFADVPQGHYAYAAIDWAAENQITRGCGDGRNFCPGDTLNRAQMVTLHITRLAAELADELSLGCDGDNVLAEMRRCCGASHLWAGYSDVHVERLSRLAVRVGRFRRSAVDLHSDVGDGYQCERIDQGWTDEALRRAGV